MKKALVFISDCSEEIEAITPLDYLRRAGVQADLCAAGKWKACEDTSLVECSHKLKILADFDIEAFFDQGGALLSDKILSYDALVIPGGMPGSKYFADDERLLSLIRLFAENGKLVTAICAAPALVLSKAGVLAATKWTCYPGMEKEAPDFAKTHLEGVPFVHDKNLITGRGPGAAEEFSMEIVKTLCGEDVAARIKAGSVQR